MRKIYFVRHGEAELNVRRLTSAAAGKLTSRGISQARFVGKKLRDIPFGPIFASPYLRTQETAKIIARYVSFRRLRTVGLLREKKLPSEIAGLSKQSQRVRKVLFLLDKMNTKDPFWHYSDEENFRDAKKRAGKFIKFLLLNSRQNDIVMVIGHEYLIKAILFTLQKRTGVYQNFKEFYNKTRIANGSITLYLL